MTIRFHCDHCGKLVEAPDEAGGRRGKCPYCKGSNYIPGSENVEEFDLIEDDEQEERLRQQEIKGLLNAEIDMLKEGGSSTSDSNTPAFSDNSKPKDLYHIVVNYCLDMADGKLERAETHVHRLRQHPGTNLQAVDDFLSGKVLEPALDIVPVKVMQGFLQNLLNELK